MASVGIDQRASSHNPMIAFAILLQNILEQRSLNTYLRKCAPREDSDQPAHSRSLIRIFTGRILDSQ